ncbi:Transcription factor spt8 [Podila clonocystis]|nr:Transcription factor spt8 [Podila clonocystis]
MDSEHESEDEFNANNDDTRTEDGSDRGEPEEDPAMNAPSDTVAKQDDVAQRTHKPLVLQSHALDCKTFDIIPLVLAVHPCNIYCMAATQCMRWVFTGSEDGYIRKYDFFASMNGKTMLTQGQRHGQVESVTKAGILTSYWENEEQPNRTLPPPGEEGSSSSAITNTSNNINNTSEMDVDIKREGSVDRAVTPVAQRASSPFEESKMSAVFSLDCHSEALYAVSGLESGSINLWTPRHEEGTCQHVFRQHTAPVSAIKLTPDQQGFISGSWDHSILHWDLNNGSVVRTYAGHGSQISSLSYQPDGQPTLTMDFSSPATNYDNNAVMLSTSVDVDEWDFADGRLIQSIKMPANSGPVSFVKSLPNNKHIICASQDNIRLWNLTELGSKSSLRPFQIIAGHHGGLISNIHVDPTCLAIALGCNVCPIFKQIGIWDEFLKNSKPVLEMNISNSQRESILKHDFRNQEEVGGSPIYVIAWPILYDMLLRRIPATRLHFGKRVVSIVQGENGVIVRTADGKSYEGDILVGADGCYSAVRQSIYEKLQRNNKLPAHDSAPMCSSFTTNSKTICWVGFQTLDKETSKENDPFRNSESGPEATEKMCKDVKDVPFVGGNGKLTLGDLIELSPKRLIKKVVIGEKLHQTWFVDRTVLLGDAASRMHPAGAMGTSFIKQ